MTIVNTWDGAAGNTNWSDAGNWDTVEDGSPITDRVPLDVDDVIIENVAQDCVIDGSSAISCGSIEFKENS